MATRDDLLRILEEKKRVRSEMSPIVAASVLLDPKERAVQEQYAALEREEAAIREDLADGQGTTAADPIVWRGTKIEFAEWIQQAFQAGKLRANSELNAHTQASQHFVYEDGTRFSPRAQQQTLRNRTKDLAP